MASSPGSRTLGFIASPPAVSRPCGLPFASVVSTFPAPSGRPKPHETSALMSIPGEELHNRIPVHRPEIASADEWMNLTKAAAFLSVSTKTLRLAAEGGEIEAEHPLADGPWLFRRA